MKVSGIGQTSSAGGTRRAARVESKGDFGRQLKEVLEPSDTQAVHATAPLGAVDAVFAAEVVEDATGEARRRTIKRGEDILDRLDMLRRALLLGSVPRSTLEGLVRLLQTQRAEQLDPRLAALMDEIELRAEVELAKLDRDQRPAP